MMKRDTIIQWNCRGLKANFTELQRLTSTLQPAAICLQETLIPVPSPINLKGFTIYSTPGPTSQRPTGGTAILVNHNTIHSRIPIQSNLQATAIRISLSRPITLCSTYIPPNSPVTTCNLEDLINQLPPPLLLLGDLNGQNPLWGGSKTNPRGKLIADVINSKDLCLLNNGSNTFLHSAHGTYSAIDISISSPDILLDCTWRVVDDLCGSDHFPITVTLSSDHVHQNTKKWLLKKANWAQFECLCWNELNPTKESSIDSMKWFTNTLLEIARKTIPLSKPKAHKHKTPWFNETCKAAIKSRKKAEKLFNIHPTTENLTKLKITRAAARRTLNTEKKQSWENFVAGLKSNTPSRRIWNMLKSMKNKGTNTQIQHIKQQDTLLTSEQEITEALAETFEKNSSQANCLPDFQQIREVQEKQHLSFHSHNQESYNLPFTIEELTTAIKNSHDTAAGPDNIHYQFLKHLTHNAQMTLLNCINEIWSSGKIPTSWKEATVIPIPKPGKDHQDTNNYRPIALTSCLCKTVERMVNHRLVWYLEKNKKINKFQSGFRKGRSTLDHLIRLETFIRDRFLNRQHVIAVFFDLEKAYDTTWKHGILQDMHQLGLRGRLPLFIKDFLTDRRFRVKVNNTYSEQHTQDLGVPQGCILSVTLFNIKINSIVQVINPNIMACLYVDDLCICSSNNHMQTLESNMQQAINNIHSWSVRNGFKISKTKTTANHFCQIRLLHPDPSLLLDGTSIKFERETKFLGLILDSKLSFIPHIHHLKKKSQTALNVLKVLTHTRWGAEFSLLKQVFKATVQSRLDYGSFIYGAARVSYVKSINTIIHQGLRLCTGAYRTTPINSLFVESNEPPPHLRRLQLGLQYVIKAHGNTENPTYQSIARNKFQKIYKRKPNTIQPLGLRTQANLADLNIDTDNICKIPSLTAPWEVKKPRVILDLSGNHKTSTHPNDYKTQFLDIQALYPAYKIIYTDGSKTDIHTAAAVSTANYNLSVRLPHHTSILTAEAHAIILALEFIQNSPYHKYMICSDSKSCLQAMESLKIEHPKIAELLSRNNTLRAQGNQVIYCWIPGHCGFKRNDIADRLAKEASRNDITKIPLPPSDLFPAIKAYIKSKWQMEWNKETNNKLHEIQPAIKPTNYKHLSRANQTTITRCRLGHTRLTHRFLLTKDEMPTCILCNTQTSIKHILIDCPGYAQIREKYYKEDDIKELFEKHTPEKILKFLKHINLKHQL